jgi:hypothetical protein
LKIDVDLALLRASFAQLAQTPYFRPILSDVAGYFVKVIDTVRDKDYSEKTLREFAHRLWITNKYLSGSAAGELPYEIEYCLSRALKDWLTEAIIITSLNPDPEFHFFRIDMVDYTEKTIRPSLKRPTSARLAPMSVPRMYRNHPLYCAPLYHELGHFLDSVYSIADLSFQKDKSRKLSTFDVALRDLSHRTEHFCDLFAAQYIGQVSSQVLSELAPQQGASDSHPATQDRIDLIQTFLDGRKDRRIDHLNSALRNLGLPELAVRYKLHLPVAEAFDDIRPVQVKTEQELHGLFPAAWAYLEEVRSGENAAWNARGNMSYPEQNSVINGLVEKSIRNFAITEAWGA